jgi:hypothetical protein
MQSALRFADGSGRRKHKNYVEVGLMVQVCKMAYLFDARNMSRNLGISERKLVLLGLPHEAGK